MMQKVHAPAFSYLMLIIVMLILLLITYFAWLESNKAYNGPSGTSAAAYYVSKNGSDSNPGTEAKPWLTIQKAADTLVAGEIVYIKQGTYNERVIVKNLEIPASTLHLLRIPEIPLQLTAPGYLWKRTTGCSR